MFRPWAIRPLARRGPRPTGHGARPTGVELEVEQMTESKRQKTSRKLTPKADPPPHPSSARLCIPHEAMDIDKNRLDVVVLALRLLGLHEGSGAPGNRSAGTPSISSMRKACSPIRSGRPLLPLCTRLVRRCADTRSHQRRLPLLATCPLSKSAPDTDPMRRFRPGAIMAGTASNPQLFTN